ncbi:MAG TPA: cation diffusion facilitator family transporter [Thermoleophilaceae bacterium]|nr:cation diffusion facilitator family transporter [Thermoleophilaceae bacterium]
MRSIDAPARAIGPDAQRHRPPSKSRAAAFSIASNAALIVLKVVAGAITGSIAILTEAVHSAIDLLASVVAFFSVRKAEEPPDPSHPYGHEKVENLTAALEGVLILVGAAIIIYESVRRIVHTAHVDTLVLGIAVVAFSALANFAVSAYLYGQARVTDSPALEGDAAHLRTDAFTSLGVLLGLVLVKVTGVEKLDPITALVVAGAIVWAGIRIVNRSSRVLVDEALPAGELAVVREAIEAYDAPEVTGFHKLRARKAGSRRHIDLHVQFRKGTTLERAHQVSHELQDAIGRRLKDSDVLIHLEPEHHPGPGGDGPFSAG